VVDYLVTTTMLIKLIPTIIPEDFLEIVTIIQPIIIALVDFLVETLTTITPTIIHQEVNSFLFHN